MKNNDKLKNNRSPVVMSKELEEVLKVYCNGHARALKQAEANNPESNDTGCRHMDVTNLRLMLSLIMCKEKHMRKIMVGS